MKTKLFYACLICCTFFFQVLAQPTSTSGITLVQPDEVNKVVKRHVVSNNVSASRQPGWRIQLKSSTDREEVLRIKVAFLNLFPDVPTYLTYQQPNFKLRVGDFTNKAEAYKLEKQINETIKGTFIIPDIVNVEPDNNVNDRPEWMRNEIRLLRLEDKRREDSLERLKSDTIGKSVPKKASTKKKKSSPSIARDSVQTKPVAKPVKTPTNSPSASKESTAATTNNKSTSSASNKKKSSSKSTTHRDPTH
jgi:hypothetical protein